MNRYIQTPSVSVVIPTLNEEKNLSQVIPFIPVWVKEIILVDGLSTDNTVSKALSLRKDIKVIMLNKPGKGAALRAGFKAATGDVIVMLDADSSHNPQEIASFVSVLKQGFDVVKGSRFVVGGGSTDITMIRRLGNLFLVGCTNLLFGARFTDLCYGYIAFWRDKLTDLHLRDDGFEIEAVLCNMALIRNLKVAEVPSFERRRAYGVSKLRPFKDGIRVLRILLRDWLRMRRKL